MEINLCVTVGKQPSIVRKGGFLLSRNFYVGTCVIFTFANTREAMRTRSRVKVKGESRSTSRILTCAYTHVKITRQWKSTLRQKYEVLKQLEM